MKGYPPGTQCVITWTDHHPRNVVQLGDIVTCMDWVAPDTTLPGKISQQIGPARVVGRRIHIPAWPIDWMRPLDDPDKAEQPATDEVPA